MLGAFGRQMIVKPAEANAHASHAARAGAEKILLRIIADVNRIARRAPTLQYSLERAAVRLPKFPAPLIGENDRPKAPPRPSAASFRFCTSRKPSLSKPSANRSASPFKQGGHFGERANPRGMLPIRVDQVADMAGIEAVGGKPAVEDIAGRLGGKAVELVERLIARHAEVGFGPRRRRRQAAANEIALRIERVVQIKYSRSLAAHNRPR